MTLYPLWFTLLLVLLLGVCVGVLVHYYGTRRPATVTRIVRRPEYFVAECLECGMRYRNHDPYDVQGWAFDHQQLRHGARR